MTIKPPPRIAEGARARLSTAMPQIQHSLAAIAAGRPGDAEVEPSRRAQVFQARTKSTLAEADLAISGQDSGAERIFGQTIDFVDVAFFERGRRASRAVVRIVTTDGAALGTGFLISPRLMMTNNHVIGSEAEAETLLAEFDYERDLEGSMRPITRFAFDPAACFLTNPADNLDYTIIAIGQRLLGSAELDSFGFIPVNGARNKHQLGDFVNIIQHPDGRPKEAVIRENQLVARTGTTLAYVADTEPGASGAPVCNVMWSLVALHHWGTPHRELIGEDGKPIPKSVNEGIRASSICSDLATLRSTLQPGPQSLIDEALRVGLEASPSTTIVQAPPSAERTTTGTGAALFVAQDGTATWTIPLSVSIKLGAPGLAVTVTDSAIASSPSPAFPAAEAKLELDADYSDRTGYDPDFLPGHPVVLPKLSAAQARLAARNLDARPGDDPFELKYHHFSVIMNGERRLAFLSAVNIDGSTSKDFDRATGTITDPMDDPSEDTSEAVELWFPERRIRDDQQTPRDFYEGQQTYDAQGNPILDRRSGGHRNRMFQKGHLTRRQDPLWGDDPDFIRYANADTFHVTNCAPQVGFFNMGIGKRRGSEATRPPAPHPGGQLYWRALEDYVLTNARADRQRVSVFTGPVLDDANDLIWDRGRQDMRGFKAPRQFWKLILRVEEGELQATALVADQSPLVDVLPEALLRGEAVTKPLPYDKIAQYHYGVEELERLTGLDFGPTVRAADTYRSTGGGRKEVRNIEDVALSRRG